MTKPFPPDTSHKSLWAFHDKYDASYAVLCDCCADELGCQVDTVGSPWPVEAQECDQDLDCEQCATKVGPE